MLLWKLPVHTSLRIESQLLLPTLIHVHTSEHYIEIMTDDIIQDVKLSSI